MNDRPWSHENSTGILCIPASLQWSLSGSDFYYEHSGEIVILINVHIAYYNHVYVF